MTLPALVRPASRKFPPCLLVHVVRSSFQEKHDPYSICTTAFLCLLFVEQEVIQLCANALLFLLVLVEQGF